ncbi:hypothetical protein OKW21_000774 [Catalinimonas alkaloidigena]|nr:hypothetical protein [Catalinimonas alkaloidigena]
MAYTMAVNFHLKLIRSRANILIAIIFLIQVPLEAQPLVIQDSIAINVPLSVSFDALGHLYIASEPGVLSKYDRQLEEVQSYSSPALGKITSLDATQMLKVFAFYENRQEFQYFDRFLTPSQTSSIKTAPFSHFSAATLSNDQMIWLFDENNIQVVKYNPIVENVVLKVNLHYFLPERADVQSLKEYGNRLYLHQGNEILVFDFLGNLIDKLPIEINQPFQISNNQLYYASGKDVFFVNLLTMEQKKYSLRSTDDIKFVILMEERLVTITNKQIKVHLMEL